MKILHIITRLILGGAQQNTVMCCAAQVRSGHDVALAYGPIYGPEGSLLDDARASGATLIEVPTLRRSILPGHDFLCYRALRRIIRAHKPDVVHTHSSKAGIVGRAAAWAEHVPAVVHTVHGLPFHDRQNPLIHRAYVAAERWAARRCHHLIAITPAMVDAFVEKGIAPRERFSVIPSGVDLTMFTPRPGAREAIRRRYNIASDAPVVGIVARLDPLKGHDDLLAIVDELAAKRPRLRMLFVGDGWHRAALERHPAVRSGRVVMTGLVPPERVADLLAAMDVKVLPSYQEGQSRTLVEALVAGCGIVGYDVGGIGSVCIDQQTGRLVPVGDRAALGEAIGWMLDHPEERRALVERGRSHVREHFDARTMVEQVEAVYHRLLAKPEQGNP